MPVNISIHRRSWVASGFALILGLGLYSYDDWVVAKKNPIVMSMLNAVELLMMSPGLAVLTLLMSEQLILKERRYQERVSHEREERFRFLGKIAASMAHEVRNPLHNIHLLSDELRPGVAAGAQELLDRINANIDRLDQATLLIYELAKPQRKIDGGGYGPVDLGPLAVSVCQEVEAKHEGPVRISHAAPGFEVRILGSIEGLRIVLHNLIRNAVEAADGGPVDISFERVGTHVQMRITNPGALDTEAISGEAESANTVGHKPGGLGVGISIARHLLALFGGRLTFSSDSGTVTTVLELQAAD